MPEIFNLSLPSFAIVVGFLFYCYGFIGFCLVLFHTRYSKPLSIIGAFAIGLLICMLFFCPTLILPIKWALLAVALFAESLFFWRCSVSEAAFLSFHTTIVGLSFCLLFRSLTAVFFNVDLHFFCSNTFHSNAPMDYILALSFAASGFLLVCLNRQKQTVMLLYVFKSKFYLRFLLLMMATLCFYLILQFSLYDSHQNLLSSKIWSLNTCIFIFCSYYWAVQYFSRLSYLADVKQKNNSLLEYLSEGKKEETMLQNLASYDPLTQLENRRSADGYIHQHIVSKSCFQLCLVDLNNLKQINDKHSHQQGDVYIQLVAQLLTSSCRQKDCVFRYGGDEFLMVFQNISKELICERMNQVNCLLQEKGQELGCPFSISYGVAEWDGVQSFHDLLADADAQMYAMKKSMKAQRA